MNRALKPIYSSRRRDTDYIHMDGDRVASGATLLNFWEWYGSDLLNNAARGAFAEYIVAIAVGDDRVFEKVRDGWDPFDLLMSGVVKIEVKSLAYIQNWLQRKEYSPTFDIARKFAWDARAGTYSDTQIRSSDVYVFCLYNRRAADAGDTLDPLNVSQWDFFILPTLVLEREVPEQKTISIGGLKRLGARKVSFEQIHDTIGEMLAGTKYTGTT